MMNRGVLQRQMFAKGGAAGFPDLNKDGDITQADILMGRGVEFKQEGGIAGMMPMPQQAMPMPQEGGQAMDPQVLNTVLGAAAEQVGDLDGAQDYEEVMNSIRGDDATIEQRYAELAGVVGEEDAQATPESVLTLVQPAMVMAASVDQGIGELAQEEMSAPVEGAMAQGIMSTVPQPEPQPMPMEGAPPVNFKDGGLVRRGDNQPVQYYKNAGLVMDGTVGDFIDSARATRPFAGGNIMQDRLEANVRDAILANALANRGSSAPQTAASATRITREAPTVDPLSKLYGESKEVYRSLLGDQEANLEDQKNLTQAQMLFDIAQTALTFAGGIPGERAGMSAAERLAAAAAANKLPQTIGARAQEQLAAKQAAEKEARTMDLAALQSAEKQRETQQASRSAFIQKQMELEAKTTTLGPDDILVNSAGEKIAEGDGSTVSVAPNTVIMNKKTGEILGKGINTQTINGIPRDVFNSLGDKGKKLILYGNPSVNGVPASIFSQLSRKDQEKILKISDEAVKGIPRTLFDGLSEEDQRKVMLGAQSGERMIKDIPESIFNKLPKVLQTQILGGTEKLSAGQVIVDITTNEEIASAPFKPEYKTVNNQLVVVDPETNKVTPLTEAPLPKAEYLQLTVDGVTTVVDTNTKTGRAAVEKANKAQETKPGSVSFNTISSAQKPPAPKGFLVRDADGNRVGVFTSYDGRNYVDGNGDIVALDSNDVPVSDTITYDVLKGESVRANANDQLEALDAQLLSGMTDADGKPLTKEAKVEVRNALTEARLGTGFWSSVYAGIDNVLGGIVAPEYFASTFKNTQDARQFTRMVAILGRSALAASPRFAVADLALTQRLFPDPDAFLANPATEARKLIPLVQELDSEKRRILTAIRDVPDMPSSQKTTLNQKLYEINRLQELLGPVMSLNTMAQDNTTVRPAISEASKLQSQAVSGNQE